MPKMLIQTLTLLTVLVSITTAVACENPLLDHTFRKLASDEQINLCRHYHRKVLLIVNTASKCGLTQQYAGLEALYSRRADEGLVVLGFPSNDFFGQEPGTENEIQDFCRLTYGVKFPMFEKTHVKGEKAHPLFQALRAQSGTFPKWNFHKYLIGRDGKLISSFGPRTRPDDEALIKALDAALEN